MHAGNMLSPDARPSEVHSCENQSLRFISVVQRISVFPMSCIVWRMLCFGCPGQGIRYTPVYPIPYLCRHLKIYINFFTLNHHRPFAEITCSQILLSQQMVGLIITWCLPPTTPWLHASGVTFFHAVRSNASAAR